MVLKRLPEDYKTFSAIVSQRDEKEDKMKFQEFNSHWGVTRRRKSRTYPITNWWRQRHSVGLRTRRIRRKKATDGAATADRRLTIRKYVVRKTPQKTRVMIAKTLHLSSKWLWTILIPLDSLLVDTGATAHIHSFWNLMTSLNPWTIT